MTERYSPTRFERRSRNGRAPGASTTALTLAGLWGERINDAGDAAGAGGPGGAGGQTASGSSEILVVDGGPSSGQTTPDSARRDGLTVVDLSDDWLPYVFSEEPGKPQPLRPYLIDLANGRFRKGTPTRALARTGTSRRSGCRPA